MLARYLTILKPDDRYGWDLDPATRWSDARQQAIDDAVMRESDQQFVDDLAVVHRTADGRDGGVHAAKESTPKSAPRDAPPAGRSKARLRPQRLASGDRITPPTRDENA